LSSRPRSHRASPATLSRSKRRLRRALTICLPIIPYATFRPTILSAITQRTPLRRTRHRLGLGRFVGPSQTRDVNSFPSTAIEAGMAAMRRVTGALAAQRRTSRRSAESL
jgi:hypothetical protein